MMEISIFIPLMVETIRSAGQVLSSLASRVKEKASNFIFDKEFVKNVITNSTEQLGSLIEATSSDVKQEIREQSIMDVMQELQAHIITFGNLLNLAKTSEITPELGERLITGGLLPLQVSLEKAKLRLKHYGNDDLYLYCYIVGTNTLIAGYGYLGQNVVSLQAELEGSIYNFQKRLLDSIAQSAVQSKREIPWDKIPYLLTTDGISELCELYFSNPQPAPKPTVISNNPPPTPTPTPTPTLVRLTQNGEYYYRAGLDYMNRGLYNHAKQEFLKAIQVSSPESNWHTASQARLMEIKTYKGI